MRSMLVIGLGRFGRHLTMSLAEMGNDIMVIDKDETVVNKLVPYVASAQIGDCRDEVVLRDIGVSNFDVCFVCISNNLESSLVITTMLKELGAKKVVTKVNHAEIQERQRSKRLCRQDQRISCKCGQCNNIRSALP